MIITKLFESSLFKIRYLSDSFEKEVSKKLSMELDLSINEFMTLTSFVIEKDCTQKILATHLKLSEAAISKLVQNLVEKKLLNRETDQQNRRQYKFELTERAEKVVEKAEKIILSSWETLFVEIHSDQKRDFNQVLDQLISKINN